MAYADDLQDVLDEAYAEFGAPAVWTPAGGSPQGLTVMFAKPLAADDSGGQWSERPKATPSRVVRVRTAELSSLGLMIPDAAIRAPAPAWRGASVNVDGVERAIVDQPTPTDDLFRLQWTFNLN